MRKIQYAMFQLGFIFLISGEITFTAGYSRMPHPKRIPSQSRSHNPKNNNKIGPLHYISGDTLSPPRIDEKTNALKDQFPLLSKEYLTNDALTIIDYTNTNVQQPALPLSSPYQHSAMEEETFQFTTTLDQYFVEQHASIKKFQAFLKAAASDALRMSHSAVGMGSLLVGMHHLYHICLSDSSFALPIGSTSIMASGLLHSSCGMFGIRRLRFDKDQEAARNAMIWPVPLQNIWFATAALSEWGLGPSDAWFSLYSTPFQVFTASSLLLTFWQLSQVSEHTGGDKTRDDEIWMPDSKTNVLLVEGAYLIWIQIQMAAVLALSMATAHDPEPILAVFDQYDALPNLLANLALNTAFFNNFIVFLTTLLRYKLISKPDQHSAVIFSVAIGTSLYIAWKVISCFFEADGGAMSHSIMASLTGGGPVI